MPSRKLPSADPFAALTQDDLLGDGITDISPEEQERIQQIPLRFIGADPMQPRRILPYGEHQQYHLEGREPSSILGEIFERTANYLAKQHIQVRTLRDLNKIFADEHHPKQPRDESNSGATAEQGDNTGPVRRHFNLDDDYSAARYIDFLFLVAIYRLAQTLGREGQIYPITVFDRYPKRTQRYVIETGERRFWAMWLVAKSPQDFPDCKQNGTIAALVVEDNPASAFRQFQENMGREPLSAIAKGRQAAIALWIANGNPKPHQLDNDFFRRVTEDSNLTLRGNADGVLSAMGNISRVHFSRLVNLNLLSDQASELADHYRVSEKHLRYVLKFDLDEQVNVIRAIIRDGLTAADIQKLHESQEDSDKTEGATEKVDNNRVALGLRKGWKALVLDHQAVPPEQEIQAILEISKGDPEIARLYVERTRDRMQALLEWLSKSEQS